jgi:hypothetical protein
MRRAVLMLAILMMSLAWTRGVLAWGDDAHRVVALIAWQYLHSPVKLRVSAMLAADTAGSADHDIASAATWADKIKPLPEWRSRTNSWHFIDLELLNPDANLACYGHPTLPPGSPASQGSPNACILDKIKQFADELRDPNISADERLIALKFLIHLVGDLHQPLHVSDNHDRGGNDVKVVGVKARSLHAFWDVDVIKPLGTDPPAIAARLIHEISEADSIAWSRGTPEQWMMETFEVSRQYVYDRQSLGEPNGVGGYRLSAEYIDGAAHQASMLLRRAGVRLAHLLNESLSDR